MMKLQTHRLILREYQPDDTDKLFSLLSDPMTMSYWPQPFTQSKVEAWINITLESYKMQGFGRYLIQLKETAEIIGDAGILKKKIAEEWVNDLGYIIHYLYWGKGYASEVATALKDYAFSVLKLESLHANMPENHPGSRRVAEKIGMKFVREFNNENNRNIKTLLYAIYRW
ncbi:GNAT family N-acetyltransferase [Limnoraphis robusta Tam1]|uniref:GNAT family N-acetyltransferase n=1 Tax=Limnoraphis robusta TaxID=1118279 RepID=UPI002B21242D|nr:GNAT family N-acetyltransferase [Limnoraphis robusta]MEA5498964.1 GNAT family N-acetyltransferase [Limnoraphis robusta BA-68 BA1]MEA5539434.1 GNAT family N-acetyltransferase [Limnoraphis robusta Tam1]